MRSMTTVSAGAISKAGVWHYRGPLTGLAHWPAQGTGLMAIETLFRHRTTETATVHSATLLWLLCARGGASLLEPFGDQAAPHGAARRCVVGWGNNPGSPERRPWRRAIYPILATSLLASSLFVSAVELAGLPSPDRTPKHFGTGAGRVSC